MAPRKDEFHMGHDGWFIPLLMLLVGVVILLVNVNVLDRVWLAYWPLLLIVLGLLKLMRSK